MLLAMPHNKTSREHVVARYPALNTNQNGLDYMPAKITSPDDPRVQQHIGKRFGLLTAIRFVEMGGGSHVRQMWEFNCQCGNTVTVPMSDAIRGHYQSCGCRQHIKHGFSKRKKRHPLYVVWSQMIGRCRNPKNSSWKYYGGRGISVCEKWKTFRAFFSDMSGGYIKGLTLDRKDNNGNYCPENCRWATREEQVNNRRVTVLIPFHGLLLTAPQWSIFFAIDRRTISHRFKKGMPLEKVFFEGNLKCCTK